MEEGYELLRRVEETENGNCDKNCKECIVFLEKYNMCYHEHYKLWKAWNKKEKERFNEILRNFTD